MIYLDLTEKIISWYSFLHIGLKIHASIKLGILMHQERDRLQYWLSDALGDHFMRSLY
jgi:hypothetical protein